jgi:heptosyltransferase II
MSDRAGVLLIGPAWVGDMIMAQSLVQVLTRGGAPVDMVAPAATASLADRMPGVRRTCLLDAGHGELGWRPRRRLANALRGAAYEQAIVLPNSFKSALVPWLAAIPRRTGWRGEHRYLLLNDIRTLDAERYPRMVDRFVALAAPPHAPPPAEIPSPMLLADRERAARVASRLALDTDRPILALCPGAEYGPAKRWPPRHFARVAVEFAGRGGQVWIFGSRAEAPIGVEIVGALPRHVQASVHDLTGRTTLIDAVDLLSLARQVISNDSGLMHVASALGLPTIALFGSTSPAFTPPLGRDAEVLRLGLPCSPCFERQCPLGHLKCLEDLAPTQVTSRLRMPD